MNSTPEEIDIVVGRNTRRLRTRFGISQTALADALDLTFQQVQKYERASNRVSAGKLYCIAAFLGVEVQAMFAGLPKVGKPDPLHCFDHDTLEVAALFDAMPSGPIR